MKSKGLFLAVLLVIFALPCHSQIQAVGCFSSDNKLKACGVHWTDYYNGVAYNCYCNCSVIPPAICTPGGSSGSGSGSGSGNLSGIDNKHSQFPIDNLYNGEASFSTSKSNATQEWWNESTKRKNTLGSENDISGVSRNSSGDAGLDSLLKKDADIYSVQLLRKSDGGMTNLEPSKGGDQKVQLTRKPDEEKAIKVNPVPLPEPGKTREDHEYIEFTRDALVTLAGVAPKPISYLGIAIVDIYAADSKQLLDCLGGDCQPTSTVLVNMASQLATDMAVQGVGDLAGYANGKLFSSLALKNGSVIKGADMGFSEFRKGIADEVIPKIGEGHFGLTNAVADAANKWLNAAGVETIYENKNEK
jgi:hypothetical protein